MQVGSLYGATGVDEAKFVFDDEKLAERWQELIDAHPTVKDLPPVVMGENGKLYIIDTLAASMAVTAGLPNVPSDFITEFYNGATRPAEAGGESMHDFLERCIDSVSDPGPSLLEYRGLNSPSFSIRRFGRKRRLKK